MRKEEWELGEIANGETLTKSDNEQEVVENHDLPPPKSLSYTPSFFFKINATDYIVVLQ